MRICSRSRRSCNLGHNGIGGTVKNRYKIVYSGTAAIAGSGNRNRSSSAGQRQQRVQTSAPCRGPFLYLLVALSTASSGL